MKRGFILVLVVVMMGMGTTAFAGSISEEPVEYSAIETSIDVTPTVIVYTPGHIEFTVTLDEGDVELGFVQGENEGEFLQLADASTSFALENHSSVGTDPRSDWFEGDLQIRITPSFIVEPESGGSTYNGVSVSVNTGESDSIEMPMNSDTEVALTFSQEQDTTSSDVIDGSDVFDVKVTFEVTPISNTIA